MPVTKLKTFLSSPREKVNKMYKMGTMLSVFVMCLIIVSNVCGETTIRLPNGAIIPVDNLSDTDKSDLIRISKKMAVPDNSIDLKSVNPNDIKEWSTLISGTIRELCQDMNVAVNDFIKTPAGLGISALIIYKVAGKDIMHRLYNMLVVPYWFISSGIILFVGFYFFRPITVYERIEEEGKKIIKTEPMRTTRFPWKKDSEAKPLFGLVLIGAFIANTIASLVIFF